MMQSAPIIFRHPGRVRRWIDPNAAHCFVLVPRLRVSIRHLFLEFVDGALSKAGFKNVEDGHHGECIRSTAFEVPLGFIQLGVQKIRWWTARIKQRFPTQVGSDE